MELEKLEVERRALIGGESPSYNFQKQMLSYSWKKKAARTYIVVFMMLGTAFFSGVVLSRTCFGLPSNQDSKTKMSKESMHGNRLAEITEKTSLEFPLQPPFRIVQVGKKRTGSTFQLHLLDAIAQVKSGDPSNINFQGYVSAAWHVIS